VIGLTSKTASAPALFRQTGAPEEEFQYSVIAFDDLKRALTA
jgi:hypothetical protein